LNPVGVLKQEEKRFFRFVSGYFFSLFDSILRGICQGKVLLGILIKFCEGKMTLEACFASFSFDFDIMMVEETVFLR